MAQRQADVVSMRDGVPTINARPAADAASSRRPAWRRRVAARRSWDLTYRAGVAVAGTTIVVVGLITVPLPGPGWLTVIAGLYVLASEFRWAKSLLRFTKTQVKRWTRWVMSRSVWVRLALATGTAAFAYGVLVVVLKLLGVPGWLPEWLPLWR